MDTRSTAEAVLLRRRRAVVRRYFNINLHIAIGLVAVRVLADACGAETTSAVASFLLPLLIAVGAIALLWLYQDAWPDVAILIVGTVCALALPQMWPDGWDFARYVLFAIPALTLHMTLNELDRIERSR